MSDSSELDDNWIDWFMDQPASQYFCQIDRSYIEDNFNLYGLRNVFPNYQETLDVILDYSEQYAYEDDYPPVAAELYGLIHARYILTTRGLDAMAKKFREREFGVCPRSLCNGQPVVPAGVVDEWRKAEMKIFCPKCQDLYNVSVETDPFTRLDGSFFGTTFPHLFFMTYPEFDPPQAKDFYVPKVYGYRIINKPPRHLVEGPISLKEERIKNAGNGKKSGKKSDKDGKSTSSSTNKNTNVTTNEMIDQMNRQAQT